MIYSNSKPSNQVRVLNSTYLRTIPEALHGYSGTQKAETLLGEERGRSKELEQRVQQVQNEKETLLQNERQTISLLVSEKASLSTELERLEGLEASTHSYDEHALHSHLMHTSEAQITGAQLEEERIKSQSLDEHVRKLQTSAEEASKQLQQSQSKEKDLSERCREQAGYLP